MKKLIMLSFVLSLLSSSVFASTDNGSYRHSIGNDIVSAISISSENIYVASNGGLTVFNKNKSSWKTYLSIAGNLPGNFVTAVAVRSDGYIFALGNSKAYSWASWLPVEYSSWQEHTLSKWPLVNSAGAQDLEIVKNGVYAVMADSLYYNGGGKWEKVSVPHNAYRIAVDGNNTLWGTSSIGVFSLDTAGNGKVWKIGEELIAGAPLEIAACGNKVVASGEEGVYVFAPDSELDHWVLAYSDKMPKNNGGSVAFFKDRIYLGQRDGSLWFFDSKWKNEMPAGKDSFGGSINCLKTNGEKLYIGTNNKTWVYSDTATFILQLSTSNVRFPHDNDIKHITPDNTGRILVGTLKGGYRYDIGSNSPSLNNSAQNVYGSIITSFTDKNGVLWIGRYGSFERITKDGSSEIYDGGTWNEAFCRPYWFVGDRGGNVVLVTSYNNKVYTYGGQGTWGCKLDQPARLGEEKILSVNSTGKHLFIATDNSAYIYDFMGGWVTQDISHHSSHGNRVICGDESIGVHAWIAEPNVLYLIGEGDITITGDCPWKNRVINDLVLDSARHQIWVATDSGAYCISSLGKPVVIPNDELADEFVNTIFIVDDQVWFGTAGGLTVWHRPQQATQIAPNKIGVNMRKANILSTQNVVIDPMGRRIFSERGRLANGLKLVKMPNGVIVKSMNIDRRYLR